MGEGERGGKGGGGGEGVGERGREGVRERGREREGGGVLKQTTIFNVSFHLRESTQKQSALKAKGSADDTS